MRKMLIFLFFFTSTIYADDFAFIVSRVYWDALPNSRKESIDTELLKYTTAPKSFEFTDTSWVYQEKGTTNEWAVCLWAGNAWALRQKEVISRSKETALRTLVANTNMFIGFTTNLTQIIDRLNLEEKPDSRPESR